MNLGGLIERVQSYDSGANIDLIRKAYDFSAAVHKGQRRKSGEPYFIHPVEVAGVIADLKLDAASVATALLHDTVEDTLTTIEEIEREFGAEVAALVDGVTKIGQISFRTREEKQAENFRKMLLAMARDIRVILIKLADRTHNMRTLTHLSSERQRAIAQETLEIYAPLAHRLGIYWMKSELEDNALRYLNPEIYYQLKRSVAKRKDERERYIHEVIAAMAKRLSEEGIEAEVTGRPKHFYSIYQKMQSQNLLYEQIYDLIAFRILVDTLRDCYAALGVVHAEWKPVPGRFKDYIAVPKANMYQSLHTTVIGPSGQRVEVQIRTHAMHRVAEEGIAAHWVYKGGEPVGRKEVARFTWLRHLLEWQQSSSDPQEFMTSVKDDLFSEEVYVFTPKGELLSFPEGSSVVDFAYRIHSEVGQHCTGARVNGKLVPLRYQLRSGDVVEIITTAQQTPSKDWLSFVRTSRARVRIRNYIKYQQRTRSVAVGREILDRDLGRYKLTLSGLRRDGRLDTLLKDLGQRDEDSLFAAVGYGRLTPQQVLAKLLPAEELKEQRPAPPVVAESPLRRLFRRMGRQEKPGILVGGHEDVLVRYGKCCEPLPGESVVGFITLGRGVTVHSIECQRVLESDPQRRIDVSWQPDAATPRTVTLEVVCVDKPGMLAAMTKVIGASGVNIVRAQIRSVADQKARNTFEVVVNHIDQLNRLRRALEKIRGVMKVSRMRG